MAYDYKTPHPSRPDLISPTQPIIRNHQYSFQSILDEGNLMNVAEAAGDNRRETRALISHVNADVAALMCKLVANDQLNVTLPDNPESITDIDTFCKTHLRNQMASYQKIQSLGNLRSFNWNSFIMKDNVDLDEYHSELTKNKAGLQRVHVSDIQPVSETCLKLISEGLKEESKILANKNILEYFNEIQISLMKLDSYYNTDIGYHNHYSCGPNTQVKQNLVKDAVFKIVLSIIYPCMPIITAYAANRCWDERNEKKFEHSSSTSVFKPRALLSAFDKVSDHSPRRVSKIRSRYRRKNRKSTRKSRRPSRKRSRRKKR